MIQQEILVGIGVRDKMVTLEETVEAYKQLPNDRLIVLPNTLHPFEQINLVKLVFEIKGFFMIKKFSEHIFGYLSGLVDMIYKWLDFRKFLIKF